jgi:hypothetical protein
MRDQNDLKRYIVPPDCGAGFIAERHGGLVVLRPLTPEALQWLKEHVTPEASWLDGRLTIEPRYFPDLAEAIIEAGFLFESDIWPSTSVH